MFSDCKQRVRACVRVVQKLQEGALNTIFGTFSTAADSGVTARRPFLVFFEFLFFSPLFICLF